jgi:transcriptional regulator with XRE-family HTH domain
MCEVSLSKQFGVVIRAYRTHRGISQETLAERSGLHPTYVSMVERGRRNPTLDVADRLARGLDASLCDLIAACQSPIPSGGE